MIIVADTTPIHYLVLIGEAEVLKELFERVIIPQAVVDELTRDRTLKSRARNRKEQIHGCTGN